MHALALIVAIAAVAADTKEEEKSARKFSAGDLGLDDLDQPAPAAPDPSESAQAGIGVNATLAPSLLGSGTVLQPSFSLRLWLEQLMIEPVVGFGLLTGADNQPTRFQFNAGVLAGYALSSGPFRPIIGGGLTFAIVSAGGTNAGLTLGPMFALEYRFQELPSLGLDAALFLPLTMELDPFVFGIGTSGGALVGFHYYFSL